MKMEPTIIPTIVKMLFKVPGLGAPDFVPAHSFSFPSFMHYED